MLSTMFMTKRDFDLIELVSVFALGLDYDLDKGRLS
ncbi:MAG: hypothetical protein K0S39_4904 [Paenibacillus sp.]|jgi:hypothetical protein|nr:hypothetical protein [Paenibacillus sp.]